MSSSVSIELNDGSKHLIQHNELKEINILGSGEFGVVKKMVHQSSNNQFAVKVYINFIWIFFQIQLIYENIS